MKATLAMSLALLAAFGCLATTEFQDLCREDLVALLKEKRETGRLLDSQLKTAQAGDWHELQETHIEERHSSKVTTLDGAVPLGEAEQAGGYFSALETSGSFTMMSAGGFEKELGGAATSGQPVSLHTYNDLQSMNPPTGSTSNVTPDMKNSGCVQAKPLPASAQTGDHRDQQRRARMMCTVCGPNDKGEPTGLAIRRHADMTGQCLSYDKTAKVRCSKLNSNNFGMAAATTPATVCTKIVELSSVMIFSRGETAAVKAHFSPAKGRGGASVVRCLVRKSSICQSGKCTVKKQLRCKSVCKLYDWRDSTWIPNSCKSSLCAGEYGKLACRHVAASA